MNRTTSTAITLFAVGVASVAIFFYLSVSRSFLTGAVEFGALIAGGSLLVVLLVFGVIDRKVIRRIFVNPTRNELVSGGVFALILAATAGLAFQFPKFPWPAGVLAALVLTGGTAAALAVRDEMRTGRWRP